MENWTTSSSQVLLFLTLYSLWKYVIFLHAKALRFSLVLQTLYVSLRILSYSSLSTDKPSTIIYPTKLNLFFSAICSGTTSRSFHTINSLLKSALERSHIMSRAGLYGLSGTHSLSGLHKNLVDLGDVALCQFLELVA